MSSTQTKVALVTGATRGIGLETARQLAEAGLHVLLAGRDRDKAAAASQSLQAHALDVDAIELDVTRSDSIAAAAQQVARKYGRLDVLVNNAGIVLDRGAKASQLPLNIWRETFDTNLFGVVETTVAFLPLLRKSTAGRIVNVSSIVGSLALNADPASPFYDFKLPAYNSSKVAVNAWTLQLAYDLRDTPIKVNSVHPGYVRTDMNDGEGEIDAREGARSSVMMALVGDDGPNGSFTYLGEVLPW